MRHGRAEGALVSGVCILTAGVLLLLAQIGYFSFSAVWRLWPALIVMVGAVKIGVDHDLGNRVWGVFLILIGSLLLLNQFGLIPYGIAQLWPLFIIGSGSSLIFRAVQRNPDEIPQTEGQGTPEMNSIYLFSGAERKFTEKNFRGGKITAVFGGFQFDFTQANIAGEVAVIEAVCVFGGGEIRVPISWEVIMKGMGVFGGYTDKTVHLPSDSTRPTKRLVIQGAAVFGGIEVKN